MSSAGIGLRLSALLDRALLPGSSHILDTRDPMEAELNSKRVQAITAYYSNQILDVFRVFAASDMALTAQAHLETLSFAELIFMMKQSGARAHTASLSSSWLAVSRAFDSYSEA